MANVATRSDMMRVLVTGGAGFIGSHLCDRLLSEGHAAHCLDNFNDFYDPAIKRANVAELMEHTAFEVTQADVRDRDALARVFAWGPDTVIHIAALAGVRPSILQPDVYMDVNVVGTARLLAQCVTSGVKRVLFASSSSVYGNRTSVPFRETDPVDDPVSPYAASKRAGELLCHAFHHLHDMDIWCLRFFTVYGPRQRPEMAIHKFVRTILAGGEVTVFGDGSSSRDYTFVDDIVDGLMAALERLEGYRILNLGNSDTIRLDALITVIEEAVGKSARRTLLPDQPGDVESTCASLDLAREVLGYAPKVSIHDGIQRFVEWYLAKGSV
jgi:UDP-glucuronate 4-epimerase